MLGNNIFLVGHLFRVVTGYFILVWLLGITLFLSIFFFLYIYKILAKSSSTVKTIEIHCKSYSALSSYRDG